MSKKALIESAVALIGSAGIGAVVMYLFDPEAGDKRRHHVRHAASHAAESALGMVSDEAHALSSRAKSLAKSLSGSAAEQAEHLADHTRHLGSYAGRLAGDLWAGASAQASDQAEHARDSMKGYYGRATRAARHALGEPTHASAAARWGGITAGAVGALALGAGLMFLLDPVQGELRRKRIREQSADYAQRGSRYIQNTAHGLADRVKSSALRGSADGASANQATAGSGSTTYQSPPSI